MRVVISQPMYFPWPGFIEMMKLADVLIWLDDAQFSKGSFTNRIQVKTAGGVKWMTIALDGKGAFQEIRRLSARDPDWRRSHRSLLATALRSAPHLDQALSLFDHAAQAPRLVDTLIASAELQAEALGALPPRRLIASQMGVDGQSWRRVLDLVLAVGGDRYVSAAGGARYLDHEAFERDGVAVSYMDYNPLPWPQAHGDFTPFITSLDLIAAKGSDAGGHVRPTTVPWRDRLAALDAKDAGADAPERKAS